MYYIISNSKEKFSCNSELELLNHLCKFNYEIEGKLRNRILDDTMVTDTDTKRIWIDWDSSILVPRTTRIIDETGKSLYNKDFVKKVLFWEYRHDIEERRLIKLRLRAKSKYLSHPFPEFRKGPIPYIRNWHHCRYYRHLRTFNEKRMTTQVESKEFNRGSRGKNLPDLWYDKYPSSLGNNSWKNQTKDRYQWQHGVRNHIASRGKGIYTVSYDKHYDIIADGIAEE